MNDFTKSFHMSCSVSPECNQDFHKPVWTSPAMTAFVCYDGRSSVGFRRLASMMAHPSMEGRLA